MQGALMNVQQGQDILLPFRSINPYSIKTVRKIRELTTQLQDSALNVHLLTPLKPQNYYLYYKVTPYNNPDVATALSQWMESDTTRVAVTVPLDSLSMYPHLFSDSVLDARQEAKTTFYTTVPMNEQFPTALQAEVIDTLYMPDDTEYALDLMLNVFTANLSAEFLNWCAQNDTALFNTVMVIRQDSSFLGTERVGDIIRITEPDYNNWPIHFEKMPRHMPETPGGTGPVTPRTTRGRITFEDNALNTNEGIRGLRVVGLRFFVAPYIRRTDANGAFESTMPSFGYVALAYIFDNEHLKLRSLDFSGSVVGSILSAVGYVMTLNLPETHIRTLGLGTDINNVNTHFPHGTKKALWGITYNGIQEANDYAATEGISSYSPLAFKHLNVLCYYNNSTTAASAPMARYISTGGGIGITNYIFHTLNLSSLIGSTLGGILPDIIISDREDIPDDSDELRRTIYHEYGHSRHYFKANQWSNLHWLQNINLTLGQHIADLPAYGTDIDANPGDYFALSKGWADYVGHSFAFRKYGSTLLNSEWDRWAGILRTGHYQFLLEEVPTFFNDFIPRGLFYDLTDSGTNEDDFDRIIGFTMADIYAQLTGSIWTIQDFRSEWEDEHPNPDNFDLFETYLNR